VTTATYRLPRPPSVNNLYYNTGYRGGRQISAHYKQWLNAASLQVMMQRIGQQRVAGPYTLTATFQRGRGDLGNLEKAISDLLVKMQVIDDDKLAEEIVLRWGEVEGCEVTVSSATFTPQRKKPVDNIAAKA